MNRKQLKEEQKRIAKRSEKTENAGKQLKAAKSNLIKAKISTKKDKEHVC